MERSLFRRLADKYQARRLEQSIAMGERPWGRQSVKMPARATISAIVTRADGSQENLGVIAESQIEVTQEQLDHFGRNN